MQYVDTDFLFSVLSLHFGMIFDIKMRNTCKWFEARAAKQVELCCNRIQADIIAKLDVSTYQLLNNMYISGSTVLGYILGINYATDIDIYFDTDETYPIADWDPEHDLQTANSIAKRKLTDALRALGFWKNSVPYRCLEYRQVKLSRADDGQDLDFIHCVKSPASTILSTFDFDFLKNYYHDGKLFIHDIDSVLCKLSTYSDYNDADGYHDNSVARISKYANRGFTVIRV